MMLYWPSIGTLQSGTGISRSTHEGLERGFGDENECRRVSPHPITARTRVSADPVYLYRRMGSVRCFGQRVVDHHRTYRSFSVRSHLSTAGMSPPSRLRLTSGPQRTVKPISASLDFC